QTLLLTPGWKEEVILGRGQASSQRISQESPVLAESLVLLCDLPDIEASRIQAQLAPRGRCRSLHSSEFRRGLRFQDMVVQLIQELQDLQQPRPSGVEGALPVPTASVLVQVVVAQREESSFLEALAAVLKVAQQEYPQLRGQLIEVEGKPEEEE